MRNGGLFRKFLLASVGVVVAAVTLSSLLGLWLSYRDHRRSLLDLQNEKAASAALAVEQFFAATQAHLLGAATDSPTLADVSELRAQQEEFRRLLFQVEAVVSAAWLDSAGTERVQVSRLDPDRLGSDLDRSTEPAVSAARRTGRGLGDVMFRDGSEPHVSLAVRTRPGGSIVVADINLRLIRDVLTSTRVGNAGIAYLVEREGAVVAHPDLSLVLRQTRVETLPQVRAALRDPRGSGAVEGRSMDGRSVLATYNGVDTVGWPVIVEQPMADVFSPLLGAALWRLGVLALGIILAVLTSVLLTRRMVAPLHVLQQGAARIGTGDLEHRIEIDTGDELEVLAAELNTMASRLLDADAGLRASRQRLVTAQDEERRRLERNLHDGAQQELVALRVALGLMEQLQQSNEDIAPLLAQAKAQASEALESLRSLARGIYPPLLASSGLAMALEGQARRSPVPVEIKTDGLGRYPQELEAAVYFCCLECLQNVAKYANASKAVVHLGEDGGCLRFRVEDDGDGFDPANVTIGAGTQNMIDRVESLGGSISIDSRPGVGTIVEGYVPLTP